MLEFGEHVHSCCFGSFGQEEPWLGGVLLAYRAFECYCLVVVHVVFTGLGQSALHSDELLDEAWLLAWREFSIQGPRWAAFLRN